MPNKSWQYEVYFFYFSSVHTRENKEFSPPTNYRDIKMETVEWKISELLETKSFGLTTSGNPAIVDSPYGKAVRFNGVDDGIFLNTNPIIGLDKFTIEAIFLPESGGQFEQRFLHFGLVTEDRMLLELRSTEEKHWYFDAFIATGQSSLVLIDKEKLHPSDTWQHTAFIIDGGNLTSYVNGVKELKGKTSVTPMKSGQASIGVRQNKISWFKGSIYSIKVTPEALTPERFTK